MGAFDMLSDDDPRVIAHEARKVNCGCRSLSEYSAQEIRAELARRRGERRKAHANARTNVKIKALEKELERLKKELL